MTRRTRDPARNRELAAIHIAAQQLGMDTSDAHPESAYRSMLWSVARVRSAGALDFAGRQRVLDHLVARGAKIARRPRRVRVAVDRVALVRKITAFLLEAGRTDEYAHGIARRMFHVDRFEWCDEQQLGKIVAALYYDAKRHDRPVRKPE